MVRRYGMAHGTGTNGYPTWDGLHGWAGILGLGWAHGLLR